MAGSARRRRIKQCVHEGLMWRSTDFLRLVAETENSLADGEDISACPDVYPFSFCLVGELCRVASEVAVLPV